MAERKQPSPARRRRSSPPARQSARTTSALPRSDELYRTLAQNFPNGAVILFDHDLRYTLADGAGLAEVGLSKEQLEGRTIWDIFPPDVCALLEPRYRAALAGTPDSFEVPFAERVYLVRTLPLRTERGDIFAGMAMTQDVTASRQAEAALRASEAELRALFAAMPDVILVIDADGVYVEIAPTNPSLLYRPAADLVGRRLHDVFPAAEADEFMGSIRRALQTRQPVHTDYSLRFDGREVWFSATIAPMSDDRVLIVARDVTEARRSEQALRDREREYRSIFESANDGLLIYDLEGRQVDFNPAACRMYGYSVDEFRQVEARQLLHADSSELLRDFSDTLRSGGEFRARGRMQRKDGTTFPADVRGTPFSYRGQPHLLAIVRDISEEAAAYELLEQRVQERTAELSILLGVAQEMVSTLALKDLLALVLRRLRQVVDYAGASIFAVDSGQITILDYLGPLPRERVMTRRYWVEPGAGYEAAIVRRQPVIIPDIWGDSPLAQALRAAHGQRLQADFGGTRSWMGVPLLVKDRLIGFLSLEHTASDHFTEQHARLALAFAQHAAVAMENARLFGALEERTRELSALLDVSKNLVSTLELRPLLSHILKSLQGVVDYTGAAVAELAGDAFVILDYQGPAEREQMLQLRIPASAASGYREVARRREPVIVGDMWADEPWLRQMREDSGDVMRRHFGYAHAWLGVPLLIKDRLIGVLRIDHVEADHFTERHARLALAFAHHAAAAIENARLFEAGRRRTEQFRVINEVGRRITSILDVDELLNQTARLIGEAFGYYHVGIGLIEADEVVYRVGAGELWDAPDFQFKPQRLKVGQEGLTGWVAGHGQLIVASDVSQEPRYVWLEGSRTRSEAVIPLIVKGQTIGVLDVQSDRLDAFDDEDVSVLQSLADQAAVAIENARWLAAEQRRAEQFRVIAEVGRHITSIRAADELLVQTARSIREAFGYYHVHIGLIEGDEVVFRTMGAGPADDPHFRHCESLRLKVGQQGLVGHAAGSGQPILVQDVEQDPRFVAAHDDPTRSELAVPIKVRGRVIGVINAESDRANAFDDSDLVVLQSLADQAAVAIDNVHWLEAEQRRAEQFRVINEVGQKITSLLAVDELLLETARLIRENFGYYYISIGVVEGDELIVKTDCPCDHDRLRIGVDGIMGLVAASGEPLLVPDVSQDARYLAPTGDSDTRAELALPIIAKGQIIGVLNVESQQLNAFDDSDVVVLQSLASQLAAALENARLYERSRLLAAVEERQKLARELHDSVSQALYGIALGARTARTLLDRDPQAQSAQAVLADPLDYVLSLAEAGMAEMRALIFELRPESLKKEGLVAALTKQADSLRSRHRLEVEVDLGAEPDIPLDVKEALHRIAQEATHNIAKHARARRVELRLGVRNGDVRLEIGDDGVGFDPQGEFPGHLGLRSMRERAERIGGTFSLDSAPGQGTRLSVKCPLAVPGPAASR